MEEIHRHAPRLEGLGGIQVRVEKPMHHALPDVQLGCGPRLNQLTVSETHPALVAGAQVPSSITLGFHGSFVRKKG